jgi:surface antigen
MLKPGIIIRRALGRAGTPATGVRVDRDFTYIRWKAGPGIWRRYETPTAIRQACWNNRPEQMIGELVFNIPYHEEEAR